MEEASSWETQEDRHPSTLISIINMIELPERMGKLEEARPLGSHTSLQGVVVCCTIVFLAHRVQRVCHWHVAQPTARSVVRPGQNKHNSLVTDLLRSGKNDASSTTSHNLERMGGSVTARSGGRRHRACDTVGRQVGTRQAGRQAGR